MLLKDFIDKEWDGKINAFARHAKLSQGTISRLYRGKGFPNLHTRKMIFAATNGIVKSADLLNGVNDE